MSNRRLFKVALLIVPLWACSSSGYATILTFSTGTGGLQAHGDHVSANSQAGHQYQKGVGWTHAVEASFGSGTELTNTSIWWNFSVPGIRNGSGPVEVTLTAADGWDVILDSIQLGGRDEQFDPPFYSAEYVAVFDGNGTDLFLESPVSVPGTSGPASTLSIPDSVRAPKIMLQFDPGGNFGDLAMDDVSFYQAPHGINLGDADRGGQVNLGDFNTLKENFGRIFLKSQHPNPRWADGDFNSDWRIDIEDFNLLKANFGRSSAAPVPEPASFTITISGFVALMTGVFRNRRSQNRPEHPGFT